jgi:hypothetical protein
MAEWLCRNAYFFAVGVVKTNDMCPRKVR